MAWEVSNVKPANIRGTKIERAEEIVSNIYNYESKEFCRVSFEFMRDFDLLTKETVNELIACTKTTMGAVSGIGGVLQEFGKNIKAKNGNPKYYTDSFVIFDNVKYYISAQWGEKYPKIFRWNFLEWIYEKAALSKDEIDKMKKIYDILTEQNKPSYNDNDNDAVENSATNDTDINQNERGINLIIYGAPGTGKSHYVEYEMNLDKDKITRVVFHPEYTYFDFVGQYRPCPVYDSNHQRNFVTADGNNADVGGEPFIDYRFVPGPFTDVLVKAWKDADNIYTLLIEELNRADAPAVFGDVFQLLDRDKDGNSEYGIVPSAEWKAYLESKKVELPKGTVKIPSNMNIIATMNSADQGVHVLDTAFKRRWDYRFMSIDTKNVDAAFTVKYAGGEPKKLKDVLARINKKLSAAPYNISEDRCIGPFFVKPNSMKKAGEEGYDGNIKAMEKILFYLWDDVLRNHGRREFFGDIATMSELYAAFPEKDIMKLYEGDNNSDE